MKKSFTINKKKTIIINIWAKVLDPINKFWVLINKKKFKQILRINQITYKINNWILRLCNIKYSKIC